MDKLNETVETSQANDTQSAVNISDKNNIWKTIFIQGIWTNNSTVVQLRH